MRGVVVILGLFMVVSTCALQVPTDGSYTTLQPKAGEKTSVWDLTTEEGSKMILACEFQATSCLMGKIKVFNGQKDIDYCPEKKSFFTENSIRNNMSLTILSVDGSITAVCHVAATTPYIDIPEPAIDSSEHGKSETATCGRRNHRVGRIVNGKEAGVNEFPFAALIMYADNNFPFCGGSIITERHILTAAHCIDGKENVTLIVAVGEHNVKSPDETPHTKIHQITARYQHDHYTYIRKNADIAILETGTPIQFNTYVGPVCLPTSGKSLVSQYIKVMGWGLTRKKIVGGRVLNHVYLRVINPEVCGVLYGIDSINPSQICTYNNEKDSCKGDSGGPLVQDDGGRYVQVAIVSFGLSCATTDPGVNADVAHYLPWIKQQIAKCSQKVNIRHE